MGRKKKHEQKEQIVEVDHSSDIKRSIAAIILFVLAILFTLGFVQNAGILGKYFNLIAAALFGWGKWISPIIMIAAGTVLLFRKETLFYVSKLIGLGAIFFSTLGFFHVFYDGADLLAKAKAGVGGGYIGYFVSFSLIALAGKIGAVVILFALFLTGIVVAFNFSLVAFVRKFIKEKMEESEGESEEIEYGDEELEDPVIETKKEDEIEYVHDPNENEENDEEEKKKPVLFKKPSWLGKKKKPIDYVWELPDIDLLESAAGKAQAGDVKKNQKIIQDTFRHFGIDVELGEIQTGPTVTQYSYRPAVGVKLSRITSLGNDLALALAAHPIRIEAPIPGKSLVGIEVPNKSVAMVRMPELMDAPEFDERTSNLLLALGKDVSGNLIFADLKKMPHLLIAGSTNSGKSVCVNTILISMLYQNSPEDLKMILVDPKRVELSLYNGIPHLLADVIVDNNKVLSALKWSIGEMERRYKLLQEVGSRDINSFNQKAEAGETRKITNHDTNETIEEELEKLPYIVIVIDELADLMATHGKEVEGAIIRLAQMARAVGIHLIVSTQRPDVSVITGLIKANIPTRIAFKVPTQIDSRTILDTGGAEKLLGNGDMLFSSAGGVRRLQGVYISESEVKRVVDFIKAQKLNNEESLDDEIELSEGNGMPSLKAQLPGTQEKIDFNTMSFSEEHEDSLYDEAKKIVIEARKASTSFLQRRLRVGYARAARLIDMLEEHGIVGPGDGAKPREVLVGSHTPAVHYDDSTDDQIVRDKWQM